MSKPGARAEGGYALTWSWDQVLRTQTREAQACIRQHRIVLAGIEEKLLRRDDVCSGLQQAPLIRGGLPGGRVICVIVCMQEHIHLQTPLLQRAENVPLN